MCYEDWPFKCHRKVICDEIKRIDGGGLKISYYIKMSLIK